jgi:hypothetical protein
MRKRTTGQSHFAAKMFDEVRNKHRQDEMPKNRASKLVYMHCAADVEWLDHPGYTASGARYMWPISTFLFGLIGKNLWLKNEQNMPTNV